MPDIEIRTAETDEEREAVYRFRYCVYVEEMGRYQATADHVGRRLVDPEDTRSCNIYATDGTEVIASFRMTWGGDGFSPRQVEQYQLAPFLAEIPAEHIVVGERTMIARAWRGSDVFARISEGSQAYNDTHDVRVVFGACEPHLISFYGYDQRPYGTRNINSPEAGYLVPLVCFPQGPEALAALRPDGAVPPIVAEALAGSGTVTSPIYLGEDRYLEVVLDELAATGAPLLDGFSDDEVLACLQRSHIVAFRKGDLLLKTGGSARNVFVLLDGELDVTRRGATIAALRPGDVVGEVAYLLEQPRGADVVAATDGRLLSLSERTLRRLVDTQPEGAAKLHRNLARQLATRLQVANA
jgi:hypothetical protein